MDGPLDAIVFDIGGTLVVETAPGTPATGLEAVLRPDVIADLTALAERGYRLAAATNTAVMDEKDVRALLAPSGLDSMLEVIATSAEVGVAKPDPAVLHAVLSRLGAVRPSRVLYIGDRDTDAVAAAAAGMPYASIDDDTVATAVETWLASRVVGRDGASC